MVANLAPLGTARCPQCGQDRPRTELWRKGRRLVCCTPCFWARRLQKRQRWEEANRARRTRQRQQGGVPCPPYEAWTVEAWKGEADVLALYQWPEWAEWPVAVVLPAFGACSCGQAGCVHLVVACLAQQDGGADDG